MRYDRLLRIISGILPEDLAIENYECIFENYEEGKKLTLFCSYFIFSEFLAYNILKYI